MNKQSKVAVILLNWNGEEDSLNCIVALKKQTAAHDVVAVDNGSTDNFVDVVEKKYPDIKLLKNQKNKGFAGGVNTGIRYAIENNYDYVALINNDAIPEPTWLSELLHPITPQTKGGAKQRSTRHSKVGIVTGKLLKTDGTIDSTGDLYTAWGLAYPRGRNEVDNGQYDSSEEVFAATGGASLYRIEMLKQIGLFDEDFFAYYEDVDLSFRAQLAGWKVFYNPMAIAHHKIGASSSKVQGLTTYMATKNIPWMLVKNVPLRLMPRILPRFLLAYTSLILFFLLKGMYRPVFKGVFVTLLLLPKKIVQRYKIQKRSTVSAKYISSVIHPNLPPSTASKLRKLKSSLKI